MDENVVNFIGNTDTNDVLYSRCDYCLHERYTVNVNHADFFLPFAVLLLWIISTYSMAIYVLERLEPRLK